MSTTPSAGDDGGISDHRAWASQIAAGYARRAEAPGLSAQTRDGLVMQRQAWERWAAVPPPSGLTAARAAGLIAAVAAAVVAALLVVWPNGPGSGATSPTTTTPAATTTTVKPADRTGWVGPAGPPAVGNGEAAFRTVCGFSHVNRDDPILFPGRPGASHLHTWFGNRSGNAASTYTSLRATPASTCQGGPLNGTAYWVPSVVAKSGQVVTPTVINVYYKVPDQRVADVEVFPPGMVMTAGQGQGHGRAGWYCSTGTTALTAVPPVCPAPGELIAQIEFPRCWDGRPDSPDHKAHLADEAFGPAGVTECPVSHPRKIPVVTYKVHYRESAATGPTTEWVLASDQMMDTGRGGSLHGDWFGGWDPSVQAEWHRMCLRGYRDCNNGTFSAAGDTLVWNPSAGRQPWDAAGVSATVLAP